MSTESQVTFENNTYRITHSKLWWKAYKGSTLIYETDGRASRESFVRALADTVREQKDGK